MDFDPYFEWFRIPRSERVGDAPPDHYVLLGIPRSETDPHRIHEAALRRMQVLRQRQAGARAELTQQLMNGVSQARLCLTDPERKAQYDAELDRRPRAEEPGGRAPAEGTRRRAPTWTFGLAGLLIGTGVIAVYVAVTTPAEDRPPVAIAPPDQRPEQEPTSNEAPRTKPEKPSPEVAQSKAATPQPSSPQPVALEAGKPPPPMAEPDKAKAPKKADTPPAKDGSAFVKLRDLPADSRAAASAEDIVHLAGIATDADEEDPAFLDREGRWLAFQRKAGGKSQFIAGERPAAEGPFTAEHLVQGLPTGARLQGFAVEPGGRSCIFATAEGQGLLRATRVDESKAWSPPTPLLAEGEPVKAAWPSLTADALELFCVRQQGGPRILALKRQAPGGEFSKPVELPLGGGFNQAGVSPDGKMLVLRGPQHLYVAKRQHEHVWSKPEPILALRALAGPNRALVASPCFSPDSRWLVFSSNRDGGAGGFDLWTVPASVLNTDTPDLSKLTVKPTAKKESTAAKEATPKTKPAAEQPKTKVASNTSKKGAKKTLVKTTAAAKDVPVKESVAEWLVLGPHPNASRETVKGAKDLEAFEGVELFRRMPKENDEAGEALVWKRATRFESPGVYFVALSFRVKANSKVRVLVESAPGGGVLWLDSQLGEVSWRPGDPWTPPDRLVKGEPISLVAGRHRLVGVVCVADPSKPLQVRLVSADGGSVLEGLSVSY